MSLFLCSSCISFERYCRKSLAKSGGLGKRIKRGDDHKGEVSIEGGVVEHFCKLWMCLVWSASCAHS